MPKAPSEGGVEPQDKIRWAPRLPPKLLERLYERDASGRRDLELCDEVGFRLYERCRAFVLVASHEVDCPLCGRTFAMLSKGISHCPRAHCSWFTTDGAYRESLRNHYTHTGRAIDAFADFHRHYPAAGSYEAKSLLIDSLIHSFHLHEKTRSPVKSVASKLLEGNKTEVVRFLDQLSAIDRAGKDRWRRAASQTIHRRVVSPDPKEE